FFEAADGIRYVHVTGVQTCALPIYRVIDGGLTTAMKGRLIELLSDGKETIVISMYLLPHTNIVTEAVSAAQLAGLSVNVTTVARSEERRVGGVCRECGGSGRHSRGT